MLMSPSFLVKILNYTYRPFANRILSFQDHRTTITDVYWRRHSIGERLIFVSLNFNDDRRSHKHDEVTFYFILVSLRSFGLFVSFIRTPLHFFGNSLPFSYLTNSMAYAIRRFNATFTRLSSNSYPEPNKPNSSYWYLFI